MRLEMLNVRRAKFFRSSCTNRTMECVGLVAPSYSLFVVQLYEASLIAHSSSPTFLHEDCAARFKVGV